MAKKKSFYVVKKGKNIGIYKSWDECKINVIGFKGAEYKGFYTIEEANEYLNSGNNEDVKQIEDTDENILVSYVDGSFYNDEYSFGVVLLLPDGKVVELNGKDNKEYAVKSRNVSGELQGAMVAIRWAKENGFKEIRICYDYEGIEKWANKSWQANSLVSKEYLDFLQNYKDIKIYYKKIKGHSGDKYNDRADYLAKRALGLI